MQQPVADHPLRLGTQHVERVRRGEARVAGALERQHAHLGTVAVGDHELVLRRERRQRVHRAAYVLLLHIGIGLLPPLQKRVAAQGYHDAHSTAQGGDEHGFDGPSVRQERASPSALYAAGDSNHLLQTST